MARVFRKRSESVREGCRLSETTPLLHGIAPSFDQGGSATGVLITDKCLEPCGDSMDSAAQTGGVQILYFVPGRGTIGKWLNRRK